MAKPDSYPASLAPDLGADHYGILPLKMQNKTMKGVIIMFGYLTLEADS